MSTNWVKIVFLRFCLYQLVKNRVLNVFVSTSWFKIVFFSFLVSTNWFKIVFFRFWCLSVGLKSRFCVFSVYQLVQNRFLLFCVYQLVKNHVFLCFLRIPISLISSAFLSRCLHVLVRILGYTMRSNYA